MEDVQEIIDFYKIQDKLIDVVYDSFPTNKAEGDALRAIFKELQNYREKYILKKQSYEKQDT